MHPTPRRSPGPWRRALAAVALLAGPWASGCGGRPADPGADGRPHLLVVLVDDLGRGDVGFTGGDIATPRLDAFAADALVLDRCYAAPMCTPARAQLLTGRHAAALGMTRNVKPDDDAGLPLGVATLPERLGEAGYRTVLTGKWHLGHARAEQRPRARGFDAAHGHLRGWLDYVTHEVDGVRDWQRDGEDLDEPGYTTDLIAAEAVRVLDGAEADRPLFLLASFNAPHTPLQAPPGVPPAPDARTLYRAMVEHLDRRVGEVLDAAARLEARGRPVVVWFASDNGANPRFGGSNGPLRGGKYTCDEGGLRVPAAVRWPGRLAPGTSDVFVGFVDIAPTLAAAAGTRLADADGVDVLPALAGAGPAPGRTLVFAVDHARVQRRAVLAAPWKLVVEEQDGRRTVRLHDVAADPLEERDRAAEQPRRVAELEAFLAP